MTTKVTKRSDGRWYGRIQVNGTRKCVYGKTEREAKQKLAEVRRQAIIYEDLPQCGNRTVNDLLDEWLATVRPRLQPRSVEEYSKVSKIYIRPIIGKMRLSKITPGHLQKLLNNLQAKGLKRQPTYVHSCLIRAFKLAVLWGWLNTNPATRVIRPTYRAERKEIWTLEELDTFIQGTEGHWLSPMWITAIGTGCRLGELLGLKWDDLDVTQGTLTVGRSLQRVEGQWIEKAPKTRAGKRTISLPQEVIAALRRQKAQQNEWHLQAGAEWCATGFVFCGKTGEPLGLGVPQRAFKREVTKLGLPILTTHGLRHIHASLLLSKNVPITMVASRLGHANPSITLEVYSHAIGRNDQEAAQVISRILSGKR